MRTLVDPVANMGPDQPGSWAHASEVTNPRSPNTNKVIKRFFIVINNISGVGLATIKHGCLLCSNAKN